MTCAEAALLYLSRGLRPIALNGKKAFQVGWNKPQTITPAQVMGWYEEDPGRNVGLPAFPGTFVLDVDTKQTHASDGLAALAKLQEEHGPLPETWTGLTGGGGLHLWFKGPPDIGNGRGALPAGLDVRGGLKGQVVVWPSIHPETGVMYTWREGHAPWDLEMATAPEWLVETIRHKPAPVVRQAIEARPAVADKQSQATLFSQAEAVACCTSNRNDRLNEAAHTLGGHVGAGRLDEFIVVAMLEGAARRCGLDEKEIGPTIRSGLAKGREKPLFAEERRRSTSQPRAQSRAADREPGCDDDVGNVDEQPRAELPPPDGALERDSDVVLAKMLIEDLRAGGTAPLVYDQGDFWRYDSERGCFVVVAGHEAKTVASSYDGRPLVIGHDRHGQPRYGELSMKAARISGCIGIAEALATKPGFFAGAPSGVAFRNADVTATEVGIVRSAPDWEKRRQNALQYDYETDAACPRWERFLLEVFAKDGEREATIAMVQEFVGAALVGVICRFAKALTLAGGGANGKSVLLDVVSALFPASLRSAITPQDAENPFRLAFLAGKRLNVVNELPSADIMASEKWKAIVSGNEITAEKKHRDAFMFRPIAAHVYAANSLPATRDHSDGFWRRQLVAVMDRKFLEAERDNGLTEYLVTHELPGIARWALEGAVRLLRSGQFTVSLTSKTAVEEWREDCDPLLAWMSERLDIGPSVGWTKAEDLYSDYKEHLSKRGHMPTAQTKMGSRLKSLDVKWRKSGSILYQATLKVTDYRSPFYGGRNNA